MVMNVPAMRDRHKAFNEIVVEREFRSTLGSYDQGQLWDFYKDQWSRLDQTFNWKPYWGANEHAPIVHWHGAKIDAALHHLSGKRLALPPSIYHHEPIFKLSPSGYAHYVPVFGGFL